MARTKDPLPEGTDSIIEDAVSEAELPAYQPTATEITIGQQSPIRATADKLSAEAAGLGHQAASKAREYAAVGKEKATGALDDISRVVSEAASTIEAKVGPHYGDYARRAADAVSGLSTTLRSKEVEEVIEDARAFVRRSPALAIGAAAVVGFALARLIRSASASAASTADAIDPGKAAPRPRKPVAHDGTAD